MNRYVAALLVVLALVGLVGVLAVGRGFANDEKAARAKCSKATLHGTYLFAQNGVEIKGNDQRPFAIAGYDVFDGNGDVKGVASGNFNGQTFRNEPLPGTYSVKANCTGTITFTNGTCYDTFIAPDGSKFAFVRTNPEFVTSGSELRGTAKRVGE
jgi:type II secretory pathway pseudopilin PulG